MNTIKELVIVFFSNVFVYFQVLTVFLSLFEVYALIVGSHYFHQIWKVRVKPRSFERITAWSGRYLFRNKFRCLMPFMCLLFFHINIIFLFLNLYDNLRSIFGIFSFFWSPHLIIFSFHLILFIFSV